MGAIYHLDKPYTRDVITDSHLSKTSSNSLKNAAITELVDNAVAPVEESNIASKGYEVGDELIYQNFLYKVINAIDQGDVLSSASGGNLQLSDNIVSQLKALFEDEDLLRKTYIDSTNFGHITNCNITFEDAFGSDDRKGGIRFYTFNGAEAGSVDYAPYTNGLGYLIHIGYYSKFQMQIVLHPSTNNIYIRNQYDADWPTTGNYGWKQLYPNIQTIQGISSYDIRLAVNEEYNPGFTLPKGIYEITASIWGFSSTADKYIHPYVNGSRPTNVPGFVLPSSVGLGNYAAIIQCPNSSNTLKMRNGGSASVSFNICMQCVKIADC